MSLIPGLPSFTLAKDDSMDSSTPGMAVIWYVSGVMYAKENMRWVSEPAGIVFIPKLQEAQFERVFQLSQYATTRRSASPPVVDGLGCLQLL